MDADGLRELAETVLAVDGLRGRPLDGEASELARGVLDLLAERDRLLCERVATGDNLARLEGERDRLLEDKAVLHLERATLREQVWRLHEQAAEERDRLKLELAGHEKAGTLMNAGMGSLSERYDEMKHENRGLRDSNAVLRAETQALREQVGRLHEQAAGRCTHPDRGSKVRVECPRCRTESAIPTDNLDDATDRLCPVCNGPLPYLRETIT